jgi:hypothetical protein
MFQLIRSLPIDCQRIIYEFAGPDPNSLRIQKEINKQFKKLGIPQFIVSMNYNNTPQIIYNYVVPDINYYITQLIRKEKWNVNISYIGTSKLIYKFTMDFSQYEKNLRKNIFFPKGCEFAVIDEGGQILPFDLPYSSLNYDILYFLKYIRGNTSQEALDNIIDHYNFHDLYIKDRWPYRERIYNAYYFLLQYK